MTISHLNSQSDRLARQLHNVFRILAKPEHALREKAIELRQVVSSAWGVQASQNKWFAWPSTAASPGVRRLKHVDWKPYGMLSILGYHVGEMQPTPQDIREHILEYSFECHLPPLHSAEYYAEWGSPQTAERLKKLANTLATLTRNAKRRNSEFMQKRLMTGNLTWLFCATDITSTCSTFGGPRPSFCSRPVTRARACCCE